MISAVTIFAVPTSILLVGFVMSAGTHFHTTQLSFVGQTDQHDALMLMDIERGLEVTLLQSREINAHSWSDDGTQAAIIMAYQGQRGLHLLDMTTNDVTLLLATARGEYVRWEGVQVSFLENPYWRRVDLRSREEVTFRTSLDENVMMSPDGNWTASVAANPNSNNPDIVVSVVGTRDYLRLTNNAEATDTLPRWSPDRRLIAFQRYQRIIDRTSAWYVIRVDEFLERASSRQKPNALQADQLTPRIPANNAQIAMMPESPWSPDGQHFLFTLSDSISTHVYMVDSDGTKLTQLTHDRTRDDTYPVWRP